MKYKSKLLDLIIQELASQGRTEDIETLMSYQVRRYDRDKLFNEVYDTIKKKLKDHQSKSVN